MIKDLTGLRFNRLTVIRAEGRDSSRGVKWLCRCDCGNEKIISGYSITSGRTKSCGCLHKEKLAERASTHRHTIGGKRSPEYECWVNMIKRCTYKKSINYKYYGARGIKVCDRWLNSFENFLADMGPRPSKYHTLERIDVNGNYEPGNCRWATRKEQQLNKRLNSNNSSGYRGISWHNRSSKWRAHIFHNNKFIELGRYDNLEDAIKARLEAEKKYWGKASG